MKKGTTSKSGPVAGRSSSPSPTKKVATESTVKTTKRTLRDGKQNGTTKESSGTGLIESNLLFYYHVAPKAGSSSAAPGTSSSAKSKGAVTKKRKLH